MFVRRLVPALLVVSFLVNGACSPKLPPQTNRQNFRIEVRNPYADPMNVTVNHTGGVTILGVVPAKKKRAYTIRMLQAQNVAIVATKKDGFAVLRQTVYLDPSRVAHVTLRNTRTAAPVADE